jgi:hypothetical protein
VKNRLYFTFGDEENAHAEFGEPEKYIYIPNNSVLKPEFLI